MNLKELVEIVAAETNTPPGKVRKISLSLLQKFAGLIDSQTDFISPEITLKTYIAPATPASEDKPARPERKLARMAVRRKKVASPEVE